MATSIAAVTSTTLSGTVDQPVGQSPTVIVRDQRSNPMIGVAVTFAVTNGGGSVTDATVTSGGSGTAKVGSWTLGPTPGTNTLTATSGSLAPVTFSAIAAVNLDANLAGRIVYTLAGALHVYTVASHQDVSLGVIGVNPKFSPDGKLITFQFSGGIGVMSSDGGTVTTVSSSGGTPSFDPTGKVIAFGSRTSGIAKVNVDGTGTTQLTSDGGIQPAWSPDGSRIAYDATVASSQQLFIVNADGSDRSQALTSKAIVDLVWRPSGKILFGLLVADGNYEIHSYDPGDASSLTRLTTVSENDFEPSWSPDGKNISWSNVSSGLWIMNADGSGQHLVVQNARQGSWGK